MVDDIDKRRAREARKARTWVEETTASELEIVSDTLFGNPFDAEKARELRIRRAVKWFESRLHPVIWRQTLNDDTYSLNRPGL